MAKKLLGPAPSGADDAADKAYVDSVSAPALTPIPAASGDALACPFSGSATGTSAVASGVWPGTPLYVSKGFPIDAIGARIATTQAVDAKLLLYNSDANNHPYQLVATATINCNVGVVWAFGTFTPVALSAGLYWGFIRSDGGTTVRFQRPQNANTLQVYIGTWIGGGLDMNLVGADVGAYASPNTTVTPVTDLIDQYHIMAIRRA